MMSQILQEALNRLRESGRPVTMQALAQAAGVSRATLYRRYGGRERVQAALGVGCAVMGCSLDRVSGTGANLGASTWKR